MTAISQGHAKIVRTERGLTLAGTRITLYDIMDYLEAGWSPTLIRDWLPLTQAQLDTALSYIDANRQAVEAEYQTGLQTAQKIQDYWAERNRQRLATLATQPPKPGQEAIHAKLQVWKARLGLTP